MLCVSNCISLAVETCPWTLVLPPSIQFQYVSIAKRSWSKEYWIFETSCSAIVQRPTSIPSTGRRCWRSCWRSTWRASAIAKTFSYHGRSTSRGTKVLFTQHSCNSNPRRWCQLHFQSNHEWLWRHNLFRVCIVSRQSIIVCWVTNSKKKRTEFVCVLRPNKPEAFRQRAFFALRSILRREEWWIGNQCCFRWNCSWPSEGAPN